MGENSRGTASLSLCAVAVPCTRRGVAGTAGVPSAITNGRLQPRTGEQIVVSEATQAALDNSVLVGHGQHGDPQDADVILCPPDAAMHDLAVQLCIAFHAVTCNTSWQQIQLRV